MPVDTVTVAPVSRQVTAGPVMLGTHRFSAGADGALEHYTDGVLRASVPPEGWADYVKTWPEAADVVAGLKKQPDKKSDRDQAGDRAAIDDRDQAAARDRLGDARRSPSLDAAADAELERLKRTRDQGY